MDPGNGPRAGQPEFEAVLEGSIVDGLRHVLGESGLQMVLSQYPLGRIAADPTMFRKAMEDIFHEAGAAIIEREVARRLLDAVGDEGVASTRTRRSWLAAASNRKIPGRASRKEKEVLRQFLALESLSEGHGAKAKGDGPRIDLTVATFGHAFKKGP